MQNDVNCKLGLVRARARQPLSAKVVSLSNRAGTEYQKTAMRLCANASLDKNQGASIQAKSIEIYHCQSDEYIAISCPWKIPGDSTISGCYMLVTDHPISVIMPPDVIFERILNFKACNEAYKNTPFWLDKICIDQSPGSEKAMAIHSMDLVYQYSGRKVVNNGKTSRFGCSLGLSFVEITSLSELTMLRKLLSSGLFENSNHDARLLVTIEEAISVLDLIEKILADDFWHRAWIFQEEFLASRHMLLLLPCKVERAGLFQTDDGSDAFGNTIGEIEISPLNFRTEVTTFCLALYRYLEAVDQDRCNEVLKYARRYTFLYRSKHTAGSNSVIKAMSPAIFEDIGQREISVLSDILAITANCCRYTMRLNPEVLNDTNESLSIAIITLFVVNGEILRHDIPREALLIQDVFQCLHAAKLPIDPPLPAGELIFIKMCRFPIFSVKPSGYSVRGVLSRLDKKIRVPLLATDQDEYRNSDDPTQNTTFTRAEANLLRKLARYLQQIRVQGGDALHTKLLEFIDKEATRLSESGFLQHWSMQHVQIMMAKAICRALIEGRDLWLSRRHTPGQWTPWLGVFIPSDSAYTSQNVSFAFTSLETGHEFKDRGAKLARKNTWMCSVEVTYHHTAREIVPRKWMNGLHFFNHKDHPGDFHVPWPQWML